MKTNLLKSIQALLVVLGLTPAITAQTAAPILFNSNIEGTPAQVYVVDADGTNLKQLTTAKTGSGGAAWHPSYQYISFFRDGNLLVMPALTEGKTVRPFTVGAAFPIGADFAPDGK